MLLLSCRLLCIRTEQVFTVCELQQWSRIEAAE
jgi:hypothetical protein